jgi:WG containing repeat
VPTLRLNKYLYANGNPILNVDPSGLFSIGEAVAALTILGILLSIPSDSSIKLRKILPVVGIYHVEAGYLELKDLSGRSQPITIYSFFSGYGSNNRNKPEREIVQLYGPIPRARYEILDDRNHSDRTHRAFYRLDRLDWFPRNDRDDVLDRIEECYDFSEGLAAVKLGNKWGYIDKSGKTVIQQQFDEAEPFSEGLAAVKVLQSNITKAGYIDKEGKIVIPLNYQDHAAFSFHEGLAPSYDEVFCKYIDKAGKIIIRLQCNIFEEFGEGFSEGVALVKMDNKYIYIDKTGKTSIPLKFDTTSLFKYGLAYVSVRNNLLKTSGYIDKTGEFIWSKTYLGD